MNRLTANARLITAATTWLRVNDGRETTQGKKQAAAQKHAQIHSSQCARRPKRSFDL